LSEEIVTLNLRIAFTEGGDARSSDAGALRVQRNNAIERLAEIIDVRTYEQSSGAINVSVGGEFLVFEGDRREVSTSLSTDRGMSIATVQFTDTQSPLVTRSGELTGLYEARDAIVAGFSDQVDRFTQTLIYEFNKAFSAGQGLSGFQELTSEHAVSLAEEPLDAAGLPFTPVNGSFDLLLHNTRTGLVSTHTILIDLNGLDEDLSLGGLAEQINNIDGVTASLSATGELTIQSDSPDSEFSFARDTSGVLAALGINTFFSGTTAGDVGVSDVLLSDSGKFAASRGGIGEDTDNAIRLAAMLDEPLPASGGVSLAGIYDQLTNELTQGSSVAAAVSEGFRAYEQTIQAEHLSISGVNLDEEAVRMITLQRVFQASARYIQSISELLDILVNL
jgi:flagellar hook-associated protein 1 FlgK